MAYNFPYLTDSKFLKEFDKSKLKDQYVKLTILTFNEKPIQQIESVITSGGFNLDGSSAIRRTGNLTIIIDNDNKFHNIETLLSVNKKVEVLIGFKNTTNKYQNYPIIWFPMGVFVIMGININHSTSGITATLTLNDKMVLLNGSCGGTLPASVVFNEIEEIDADGNIIIRQPTIYQIIQELVNHFGKEQLGKIIISDIDDRIKRVVKWTGSTPLYYTKYINGNSSTHEYSTNYNVISRYGSFVKQFNYGEDIGYIYSDFTFPGELVGNAGETVVTILDKIKNTLGNYEYFYDINGNFRFQQIKNYLNKSSSTLMLDQLRAGDYLVDYAGGKSVYAFEDAEIIQSYSNAPQYQQIKNDFVIWGKRTTPTGSTIPIRYHLAIDTKPKIGNTYKVFFYEDPDDNIKKAKMPFNFEDRTDFPEVGEVGQYYSVIDSSIVYKWNNDTKTYENTGYKTKNITTTDYRTQLYLQGVSSEVLGLENNDYYTELKNEWPKIYDVERGQFLEAATAQPSDIDFFLDFIDSEEDISEFSVQNIGRRTYTFSDDSINCIFQPDNPNLVIIESGRGDQTREKMAQCTTKGQDYVLVDSAIYSMLTNGGALKSAHQEIKKDLYLYTNYNEQITLTALPIYYLEPNTRITVQDPDAGIYGDYMIKSISLPLDINGTMNLTCTKALERI